MENNTIEDFSKTVANLFGWVFMIIAFLISISVVIFFWELITDHENSKAMKIVSQFLNSDKPSLIIFDGDRESKISIAYEVRLFLSYTLGILSLAVVSSFFSGLVHAAINLFSYARKADSGKEF